MGAGWSDRQSKSSIWEGFLEEGMSKLKNEEEDMGNAGETDWQEKHEQVSEANRSALREPQPLGSMQ